REPSPIAMFVELLPGRRGYVRRGEFGRAYAARLRGHRIGAKINVAIASIHGSRIDLRLLFPPIQRGSRILGYVTGFLKGRYGHARAGVFVEIKPGVDGLLHFSDVSEKYLSKLKEGDALYVVVAGIARGRDGKIKYDLHCH